MARTKKLRNMKVLVVQLAASTMPLIAFRSFQSLLCGAYHFLKGNELMEDDVGYIFHTIIYNAHFNPLFSFEPARTSKS